MPKGDAQSAKKRPQPPVKIIGVALPPGLVRAGNGLARLIFRFEWLTLFAVALALLLAAYTKILTGSEFVTAVFMILFVIVFLKLGEWRVRSIEAENRRKAAQIRGGSAAPKQLRIPGLGPISKKPHEGGPPGPAPGNREPQ